MAKTFAQIKAQIQQLEARAEELKAKEVRGVVARIREAIDYYGLTVADLFGSPSRGRPSKGAKGQTATAGHRGGSRGPAPVKYRDDEGNTWSGRGLKPRWLTAAIAKGKRTEDFLV